MPVKTRKNRKQHGGSLVQFQKEITCVYLETILMIKLYHWKTHSYAAHKSTDDLYSKLNENIDRFMEVLFGKSGHRMDFTDKKTIAFIDVTSKEELIKKVEQFKSYLVSLDNNPALKTMSNSDLLNIRDEILGDMNQFLYLLTFK